MKKAICVIVKNEHRYIEEWIRYHLNLGFDEIFIGEDYGSKSHKSIIDKFDNSKIHIIDINKYIPNYHCTQGKKARQIVFYNKIFQEYKSDFDWIANIDIDEFIILENETLDAFLSDFSEYEGVCLAWKYYGANGHLKAPEGNVMDNYTTYIENAPNDCQVKTIVNCKKAESILFMHSATYNCVNVFKEYDFKKSLCGMKYAKRKYWKRAWINHYFTRSWEEWVERMMRGNMRNNYRTLDTFFLYNPDMCDKQKELTYKAYFEKSDKFHTTNIYSKKYSLYNDEYLKDIKNNFLKKINKYKK